MKILVFTGGLGNQLFGYAFYLHLKRIFPNECFYGLYGKKLSEHYGLELDKWFRVNLPSQPWWVLPVTAFFYLYKQCFPNSRWLDLNQRDWKHPKAIVFFPFKFNKCFIPNEHNWIQWKVDESALSEYNRKALFEIRQSNACFVHVRRGDYLSANYKALFEDCCTLEYYQKALVKIKEIYSDIRFICFSDDIPWMKENLKLGDNAFYVNWNSGKDSPLDMYLMSQCCHGIIANSTFSYWGARLGQEKEYIFYPKKWWNSEHGNPDIFLDNWIGL